MRRIFLLFFLTLMAATAMASVYRVDIDDVSRVDVFIKLDEAPLSGLSNGVNSIDMGSERYLRVVAKEGVLITEASTIDDYYNEERPIYVESENGRQFVDLNTSFPEDEWFRIRTAGTGDARSASCTVKIDTPSKVKLMRKASDEAIELTPGENTVKFDPSSENELYLEPTGKPLYSVTKNGEPLTAPFRYTIPVKQDDYIDIQADYPDVKYSVKFTLTGNGAEDFIREVDVDGRPEFGWANAGFSVQAGAELSMKGNTTEYEVLSFTVNGVSEMFTNPTKIIITKDTEIAFEVRKYTSFNMTVTIDDPAKAHVYRGYSYNNDELQLVKGANTVEITRNTPIISIVPVEGFYIESLHISGYDYEVEELQRTPIMVGSLTDNEELIITTATIVRDKKAMVYVENLEAAEGYFRLLRADLSEVEGITEGYNELAFFDRDNLFRFETGGPTTAYVYLNDEAIEPAPGGFNYTPDLSEGDVMKLFFGKEPESYTVTVETDNTTEGKVKIVRDHIRDISSSTSFTALQNTLVAVGVEGDVDVTLNGKPLTANADGAYSFPVTADTLLAVKAPTSGIETIDADTGKDGKIYNLQGIEISRPADKLPAGIYIIGGRKIIVK